MIDFSTPFMNHGISIMIKRVKQSESMFSFMSPLSKEIWVRVVSDDDEYPACTNEIPNESALFYCLFPVCFVVVVCCARHSNHCRCVGGNGHFRFAFCSAMSV